MSCHWEELHLTASPLKFFKELSSLLALSKFPPPYIYSRYGYYVWPLLSPSWPRRNVVVELGWLLLFEIQQTLHINGVRKLGNVAYLTAAGRERV